MLMRNPANLSRSILTWSSLDAEPCTFDDFQLLVNYWCHNRARYFGPNTSWHMKCIIVHHLKDS